MQINIKTTEPNKDIIIELTSKIPKVTGENIIARIALTYSLQNNKKFSSSDFGLYDSKGKEYKDNVLFDYEHKDIYIALICQYN